MAFWMQTRSVEVNEGRLGSSELSIGSVKVICGSGRLLHFGAARGDHLPSRPKAKYDSGPTPAELTSTAATIHIRFEPRIWLAGRRLMSLSTARLEDGFGNCCGNDQPAAAVAEVAPPSGHDILRVHAPSLMACTLYREEIRRLTRSRLGVYMSHAVSPGAVALTTSRPGLTGSGESQILLRRVRGRTLTLPPAYRLSATNLAAGPVIFRGIRTARPRAPWAWFPENGVQGCPRAGLAKGQRTQHGGVDNIRGAEPPGTGVRGGSPGNLLSIFCCERSLLGGTAARFPGLSAPSRSINSRGDRPPTDGRSPWIQLPGPVSGYSPFSSPSPPCSI